MYVFSRKTFILLMDSGKSHLDAKVEQGFAGINSSVKIRHRGLTPLMQFLNIHEKSRLTKTRNNLYTLKHKNCSYQGKRKGSNKKEIKMKIA